MDRHSSTTAVTRPSDSRNLGFRAVCITCREGGSRAFAAFHEYPLPASMLNGDLGACSFSTSSPRAWEMRIEELRARTLSVLLVSRCE
jgi:hypothetical protein